VTKRVNKKKKGFQKSGKVVVTTQQQADKEGILT